MAIRLEDYAHSPAHYAVALSNHSNLSKLISRLPRLGDPSQIHTEKDSVTQEKIASEISSLLDRRDVPFGETPLHLAVRLNDPFAARLLSSAGADISLHNAAGWSPLQEAVCARKTDVALTLLRAHHRAAWAKWRRRLPLLVAVLRRMRDFYMEISFHFESSLLPFVGRIAPSDTYRIWKRDGNLRADTSLAGFDGLKIHRADQSFLFLGDGDRSFDLPPGSLLVLNRTEKRIFDAFENAGSPLSASDEAGFWSQTSVYRPGMDVTRAELISRTNWRNQTKVESIGEWKARVYEVQNVVFSFRTRKVEDESVAPLELNEDAEEGFLVAENPDMGMCSRRHSSFEKSDLRYNNKGKMKEDREWVNFGRKSVDLPPPPPPVMAMPEKRRVLDEKKMGKKAVTSKESEYTKSLKPSVWLTENFPLKIEELIPLLDILASKVKAVRRLRELLTTKFPLGTFPVKVAIPVVPTVRVVVTFTKFVDLQATEQFFTPLSSPGHLQSFSEEHKTEQSTWNSWLKRPKDESAKHSSSSRFKSENLAAQVDPFAIPRDYAWSSMDEKRGKLKKSKSKKGK